MKRFCPKTSTPSRYPLAPSFGFTLIELLVVITITSTLFAIGIAAYNNFNKGQILTQTANTLKNDLRLVQSKASSGEKDATICSGKTLDGWYMSFANSSYSIFGKCGGVSFSTKSVNLPSGISFNPLPSSNPIQFVLLARGTSVDVITITLLSTSGTKVVTVTVTKSGEIN